MRVMSERIVRGYIIPIIRYGGVTYCEFIDDEVRLRLKELLKDILIGVIKDYLTSINSNKVRGIRDLNHILNLYLIYLRSIYYPESIPAFIPSPIDGLYIHYKECHAKGECSKPLYLEDGLLEHFNSIYLRIENRETLFPRILDNIRMMRWEDLMNLIRYPADTRPGPNTSSLLIHLYCVSAIASSIYINRFGLGDEGGLATIRLLSLFHDIGKIWRWRGHERESGIFLKEIFIDSGLVEEGSEAHRLLTDVINFLMGEEYPDRMNQLVDIFRLADGVASNIDRVRETIPIILSEYRDLYDRLNKEMMNYLESRGMEYSSDFNENYRRIFNDWEFWNIYLKDYLVRDLTVAICRYLSWIHADNKVITYLREGEAEVLTEDAVVLRLDVRDIQGYIYSRDIRSLIGGSRVIDAILFQSIPDILFNLNLPFELIQVFGGGNISLILPANLLEEVGNRVKNGLRVKGVKLAIGSSKLYDNYIVINRELDKSMLRDKMSIDEDIKWIDVEIFKLCEYCNKRYATRDINGRDKVCDVCYFKHSIGDVGYFKSRIILLLNNRILGIDDAMKLIKPDTDIIYYISGHEVDEASSREVRDELRDIALIRFDGNIIGQFMASAISLTDIFERSIRVDGSVKRGIAEFIDILRGARLNHDLARFILGYIYIGGDDGVLLMPSYLAIPFALYLLNSYYLNMGCKSTLSIAIISANAKHPIIDLYEAVGHLLDNYSKGRGGRSLCHKYCHGERVNEIGRDFRGSISLYHIDRGIITDESIDTVLKILFSDGYSSQHNHAYILANRDEAKSILRLLGIIHENFKDIDIDNLRDKIRDYIRILREDWDNFRSRLKELRRGLNRVFEVNVAGDYNIRIKLMYIRKERDIGGVESRQLLEGIFTTCNGKIILRLADLDYILKMLGGK